MADEASPYIDLDGLKRAVGILDARYAGAGHKHGTSDIEGLTALIEGRAPLHHAHKMDEVVGLKTSLAGKADNGHVHSSLASAALDAGADLDELDLHLGAPALSLAVAPAGAAGLPDGVEGPALVACELLRWAAEDDFASRQTLADPADGTQWQRFCASGEWTAWARSYTSASMPTPAEIGAADRVHGHVVADVEGLRAELDGKAAASHTHTVGEVESLQQTLDAKAPREHMHAMSDVTGLAGALAGKSDEGHLHEIADVVNLGSELAGKSPVTHGHDAATKVEAGFMSAADKDKLDGIADGATRVTAVSQLSNDMGYVNADQVAQAVQGGTAGMATQSWVESKGYQNAQQVSDEIDSRGYQTAQQVQAAVDAGTEDMATETWVEGLGYQTAAQVDAAVEAKGYATTAEMQAAVEQATDDMATQTWVAGKGYQNAEQVESAITAKGYQTAAQVESAITAKGYDTAASVDGKVEDAKTELTAAINSAVSTVYRVKGSCARADLPADPDTGDVWSLTDEDGMNVVWTGSAWDELGVPVDLTWDAITGKPSTFAPSAHTHAQADVEGLSAALAGKSDTGHGHAVADVSGLQAALDSKSDTGHGHAVSDVSGLQTALDGKAASSHSHGIAQVTGLQDALDGKSDTGHGHAVADVSGLQTALDGKAASTHSHTTAQVTGLDAALAGKADSGHSHAVATAAAAGFLRQLDGSTAHYLRGDGSWATPPNTTYGNATQSVAGLMSAADKVKLDGVATGANRYVHPGYTARASGLYKVAVDATGHVSGVAAVTKADITALGIPGSVGEDTDTTYTLTKSGSTIKLTGSDGSETSVTDSNTTYTLASFGVTATAAELNRMDGVTSNVQTQLNGKAASSHTHNYAASPSAGGAATYAYLPRVSQDANTLPGSTRGVWQEYSSGAANLPSLHYYHVFTGQGSDANYNTQLALGMTTTGLYYRNRQAGTWGGWNKVYTSATKPTPSEIGAAASSHTHTPASIGAAASSHTHTIAQVTNLQSTLDGKAASSHSHALTALTGTLAIAHGGTGATTAAAARSALGITPANIGAAASSHTHSYAGSSSAGGAATSANKLNVTQLSSQNLNDYRTPGTMYQAGGGNTCTNKPSGIDNFGMTVVQTANGWQTQLLYGSDDRIYTRRWNGTGWTAWSRVYTTTAKPTASEIGAAAASHTHSIANVSGLQDALNGKAASSHSHAASAITSGTLSADRLPTVPIAKGGTGATSASAARTALGITPANIGAAASSHSHPASQVTGLTASRALVSDSSGHPAVSAVTATELGYLDGVTSNVQTQLNGKAASSHSHSYLPLSGGTLTGAVTHNAKNNRYTCSGGSWINGKTATNVPIVFPTASTMDGSRYDPYMWGQNADGDVWNFGAGASNQVGFFGFNSGRTDNGSDWSVYMSITTGRLTSTAGFTGALSGNATTATTLQTARTINGTSFNGGANITTANWGTARTLTIGSTGKSVNGSGNVSWSLSEIGAAAANHTHSGYAASSHNHAASNITSGTLSVDRLPTVSVAKGGTGATTAAQARTNLGAAASSHNHSAANITSGTLAVARGGTGVTSDDALRQKVLNFPSSADLLDYLGL